MDIRKEAHLLKESILVALQGCLSSFGTNTSSFLTNLSVFEPIPFRHHL